MGWGAVERLRRSCLRLLQMGGPSHRARAAYALSMPVKPYCNAGTAMLSSPMPAFCVQVGWAATFLIFGLVGMAYAALTIFTLPAEGPSLPHRHHHHQQQHPAAGAGADAEAEAGKGSGDTGTGRLQQQRRRLGGAAVAHLAMLCVTHSVISWGFFILQSWIPMFIHSLGMQDLEAVGVLSALPWLVSLGLVICPAPRQTLKLLFGTVGWMVRRVVGSSGAQVVMD